MEVIYIVLLYMSVVGIGAAIFLYGKPDGNSVFDKLYRLFVRHLPGALKFILRLVCGQRGPDALDSTWNYLVWQCNPLVQAFYLAILSCGYLAFATYAHPHLPNAYASEYHKYSGFACVMTALLFWLKCSFSDPGTVTTRNARALTKVYPYDCQIYHKGNCKTCKTIKPARSKHCGLCDICVCRFDHHCIWVNNCIGVGNHRHFLGFLLSHCVLTAYGATVGTLILVSIVEKKRLLAATFIDASGAEFQATYKTIFIFMVANYNAIVFVTILCAIMSVVLFGFFMWHFNLVRIGETSNEVSKWRMLKEFLYDHQQKDEEARKFLRDLHNSYNKGLCQNLKEIIYPINVYDYVSNPGDPAETDDEVSEKETNGQPSRDHSPNEDAAVEEMPRSKGKKSGRRRN